MNNIQSNCGKLLDLCNYLQNNKNITEADFQNTISSISKEILRLEKNVVDITRLSPRYKENVIHVLKNLESEFENRTLCVEKVQEIKNQIVQVQKEVQNIPSEKIGLKIAIFADFDGTTDANGSIIKRVSLALEQNVPFITTRSMLTGSAIQEGEGRQKILQTKKIESLLLDKQSEWEIYQFNDSNSKEQGELLIFLPRKVLPELSGKEKLQALDFKSDESLKPISAVQALQRPKGNHSIHDLFKIFEQNPKTDKLFYIFGHGNEERVASLLSENYQLFLDFLETQRCKGLLVTSCDAGGTSSLLNLPQRPLEKPGVSRFIDQEKTHHFPTIVRSIGDFSTLSNQESEDNISLFLDEVSTLIEDSPQSISAFRKRLSNLERGDKSFENFMKVYFPRSPGISGGFRAIGETGQDYSLTYITAKKNEHLSKDKQELSIKNKEILEIQPLATQVPLVFKESNPTMISMIPGKGHHFLRSIQLAGSSTIPTEFIKNNFNVYDKRSFSGESAFFIETLKGKNALEDVILYFTPNQCMSLYKEGNQCYLLDKNGVKAITPFQYTLISQEIEEATRGTESAIRTASAGQETESVFRESLNRSFDLTSWMQGTNDKERLEFINSKSLTDNEKAELVFFLLKRNDTSLAFELIKNGSLSPNIKDIYRVPLISYAIRQNNQALIDYLFQRKVDLNVHDPSQSGDTPLHQAIKRGDKKLVERMLSDDQVKLELENEFNLSPLFYAIGNYPDIFEILKNKGMEKGMTRIDHLNSKGETLLSKCMTFHKLKMVNSSLEAGAVPNKELKMVNSLLAAGADPNKGKPSALTQAMYTSDLNLVKQLLDHGGKPFEKDSSGLVPFVEAVLWGSSEMVQLLLDRPDCNMNIQDCDLVTPLIAAFSSGNRDKIDAIKRKNAPLIAAFSSENQDVIEAIKEKNPKFNVPWSPAIQALIGAIKDEGLLAQLLEDSKTASDLFQKELLKLLLENNPKYLLKYIESAPFDFNSENGISLFFEIGEKAAINFEKYKDLLDLFLRKGVDIDEHVENISNMSQDDNDSSDYTLLDIALKSSNRDYINFLLDHGADLSETNSFLQSLIAIVEMGDLQLIKRIPLSEIAESGEFLLEAAIDNLKNGSHAEEIFKWLVENGANLNTEIESNNESPFCQVIKTGDLSLVEYCLSHGAEFDNPELPSSPLFTAAELTNDPNGTIFKKLLEKGASISASQENPLLNIIKTGNLDLLEFCFKLGAKIDDTQNQKDEAIVNAVDSGNPLMLQKLVERGFTISKDILEYRSLLTLAYQKGGLPLLKNVIALQNDISSFNKYDKTELIQKVTQNQDVVTLHFLSQKGFNSLGTDISE